ncbi:MAG: NUDIX hydrolase [Candidatus Poseidoniaceae archaeon]|jgi:8-oxo-dGTP diphosphatase|nr:NUDIX hydrolase [Candidatus Poseidoniaceae archaeon]
MPACEKCGQWPQPSIAVDAVVVNNGKILLIRRGNEPWKGKLALPGGFVDVEEDPKNAVLRELKEETGIVGEVERVICVKGNPERDPRGHVISIAYLVTADGEPVAGDDAENAEWYTLSEINNLAGDHMEIISEFANN